MNSMQYNNCYLIVYLLYVPIVYVLIGYFSMATSIHYHVTLQQAWIAEATQILGNFSKLCQEITCVFVCLETPKYKCYYHTFHIFKALILLLPVYLIATVGIGIWNFSNFATKKMILIIQVSLIQNQELSCPYYRGFLNSGSWLKEVALYNIRIQNKEGKVHGHMAEFFNKCLAIYTNVLDHFILFCTKC